MRGKDAPYEQQELVHAERIDMGPLFGEDLPKGDEEGRLR